MIERTTQAQFRRLAGALARAWNLGDAERAVRCFAEDAAYTEPPGRRTHLGRQAIFKFFGGAEKPNPPMSMVWRHLAFDERTQVGFGEYSFRGRHRYHGIAVIRLKGGRIANWRAYQYRTGLPWRRYTAANPF